MKAERATTAERWRQIEDLLDVALEQAPAERAAMLEGACAGDAELRAEVESLLAHEKQTEDFIETPAFAFAADLISDDEDESVLGRRFGAYKIIREIGRGGMGAVYLAERFDGEFQQQVALKIVRHSFAGPELARRFRQERQILASLNHPFIARLLDGGVSADGEPFLAMEYVEGVRVDDYCDEHNLPTRERLKLFLHVCQGVGYAHQHLVVHRDLKPSNILVTEEGTPKLLDFGIAKLLDAEAAAEHTQTNFRAFTPDYAAPEQVRGERVTTASDVYSLGVLLGDLLHVGRGASHVEIEPAFGAWRSESLNERKTAATNVPTNGTGEISNLKSQISESVSSELKNIIAMARREEPARRYASVTQFAEDVQRYLDGLPVRAQRDTFTYRAEKFIRRNRITVGAIALVALSLVAGTTFALWQANVARIERDRAERRFADVRQLANALLTDIAPKIERLEGSTEARQVIVNQSLKYLDSLARESGDDLQLQSELAAAYEKIGSLQGDMRKPSLSDLTGAIASFQRATVIRRRLVEASPSDAEWRRLLAENLRVLGNTRASGESDVRGANENTAEALKIYENLIVEKPDALKLQTAYLETQIEHAMGYGDNNQYAEAIPILQSAADRLEELNQRTPNDDEVLRVLSKGRAILGHTLSWNSRQPEAEAEMAKGVAIIESLVAKHPNDTTLRQSLWGTYLLAGGIYDTIDDRRSFQISEQALKIVEETMAMDKANAQARHNLAKTLSRLGAASANLGKPVEALSYLERAAVILSGLYERDPKNVSYKDDLGKLHSRLGAARHKQRDWRGSLTEYEKAADLFGQLTQDDPNDLYSRREVALARKNIGDVHRDLTHTTAGSTRQAHLRTAKENYERALTILLELQSNNTFAGSDRKYLEEVQTAMRQYE